MNQPRETLLEITFRPALRKETGIRVHHDGRYMYREGPGEWEDVWTFTPEEMDVLRENIRSSDFFSIPAEVPVQQQVDDGTDVTWKVHLAGNTHQVHIPPGASAPALDNLYRAFTRLRSRPLEKSVWTVRRKDGATKHFTVTGSVNAVPALRPLLAAMFAPGGKQTEQDARPSAGEPLVKTTWFTGDGVQETEYFADGRYVQRSENGQVRSTQFSEAHLQGVLKAIEAIDWPSVPEVIETKES